MSNFSQIRGVWYVFSCVFMLFASNLFLGIASSDMECTECVQLGGVFEQRFHEIGGALSLATEHHNINASSRRFQVHFLIDIINTKDAFKIASLICRQYSRGIMAMVASVEPDSFDTLHSYSNTFNMPLVTPSFPENVPRPSSGLMDYALSLQPDYHRAILDIIKHYNWDHIIYLYDSHDGLLRLQDLFRSMQPANATFSLRAVQRISSSKEALDCLLSLEMKNRWSNKYIVLDSSLELAKDLIKSHVQDVRMGRRNYHYLLAGLVMDDRWEEDISEFGALNITGFRIVDTSSSYVRDFLYTWRDLDPKSHPGAGKYISADSALLYDSVRVLTQAISRYQKENPIEALSSDTYRHTICDLNGSYQVFRQGEAISRILREVEIQGLTGNISFNEEGRRVDYSLDVVEMTVNSQTVKIGAWSDVYGFQTYRFNQQVPPPPRKLPRNKNYIITTIMEKPFIMLRQDGNHSGNERFEGYAKDLANLLARKIGFNYTMRLVVDGMYGSLDKSRTGKWNGMVGELIYKEADIAIAPLTITSTRERLIDFTKPFMTQGISIMIKRPTQKNAGVFSFLSPLSEEIWMCIIFACVGVSIVLFLVSRFSPYEWRVVESFSKTTVTNDFTISNSVWFTLGALMQQGIDLCPRSYSGRIVGTVWWFFTLILISSYTANLAAFLTVERMISPIESADDLSIQTAVEYGMIRGGSTEEFFKKTRVPIYSRMWDFMSARKHVLAVSYEDGISRVRASKGKYAFLLENVRNDYINEQLPCDTMQIGKNLNSNGYGIATTKGSPLKDPINTAILQLIEDGTLTQLKNKWWYRNSQCGYRKQGEIGSSLTLSNIAGIFYILTGGLVLSLIVALVEFCYKSKMDARRTKLSLSDAMKAKAKMSITGGKELDNGRSTSSQPLLGQTQLRTSVHQHAHHAHLHHQHQHPVQTGEQTQINYGTRTTALQGSVSPCYNPNIKSSHSQISFGSTPPPPIQEGTIPMSNTHSSSPHAHSPPDPLNKTTIVHTPTTHSFADLPF